MPFDDWMAQLEARHLADLQFSQVTRALRALSSAYVERRERIAEGAALSGAGKRAAFALFYGPLHFLVVREVVAALRLDRGCSPRLLDVGCGTGAAGVAWATACETRPSVTGIDRSAWALAEAAHTYAAFRVAGRTRRGDMDAAAWPDPPSAVLAAFAVNELPEAARHRLLARLIDRARRGDPVLVVEPLAKSAAPWWRTWRMAFEEVGGKAHEWRFRTALPAIVAKLDRAAGLNHRELTARSLSVRK